MLLWHVTTGAIGAFRLPSQPTANAAAQQEQAPSAAATAAAAAAGAGGVPAKRKFTETHHYDGDSGSFPPRSVWEAGAMWEDLAGADEQQQGGEEGEDEGVQSLQGTGLVQPHTMAYL